VDRTATSRGLAYRSRAHRFKGDRDRVDELDGWSVRGRGRATWCTARAGSSASKGCRHPSGEGAIRSWQQPIIPPARESRLSSGILREEFNGVLHSCYRPRWSRATPISCNFAPRAGHPQTNMVSTRGAGVRYRSISPDAGAAGCFPTCPVGTASGSTASSNRNMLVRANRRGGTARGLLLAHPGQIASCCSGQTV